MLTVSNATFRRFARELVPSAALVSRQKSIVPGFDDLESKNHWEVEELKSA
jgi:hypothetical protein